MSIVRVERVYLPVMQKNLSLPSVLVVVVVLAMVAVGCSSNDTASDITSTTITVTTVPESELTVDQQEFVDAYAATAGDGAEPTEALAAGETVCLNLALLQASGTPPGHAADAIDLILLDGASVGEKAEFGLILALAPSTLCLDTQRYAESVAYWLGF